MHNIRFFTLLAALLSSFAFVTAQDERSQRLAQWETYALPSEAFTRFMDKKQGFSLWRPSAWQEGSGPRIPLSFSAAAGLQTVIVITETIPEGYGVANYTTALLQNLRKQPIKLETLIVRPVLIGGVEGREICYEIEGAAGTVRQTYWVTQVGPLGYNFVLTTPLAEQAVLEPYFKRMMMSVRFNVAGHWDEDFETLRAKFATTAKSEKDAEAAKLSEAIRTAKEPTEVVTKRITELARQAPEVVLEMLTDYDLNVRAASITALGKLSDARCNEVLVWALGDKDAFCSTAAAQALSERGAAGLAALKSSLPKLSVHSSAVLRVAALLRDDAARELAEELLKSEQVSQQRLGLKLAVALPLVGLRLPYAKLFTTDDVQVISYAMEAVRLRRSTEDIPDLLKMLGTETELWAIHALGELATPEITAQLEARQKIVGARYDKVIASKGVMTVKGTTSLPPPPPPPPPMPKGSGAKKNGAKRPSLGVPGGIPAGMPDEASVIAGYANSSSPASTPPAIFKSEVELTRLWSVVIELEDALAKIKLRDRWNNAKDEPTRRAIRADANKSDRLEQWASLTLNSATASVAASDFDLSKLKNAPATGETLFPSNATLYLTAPNFEQTIHQLDHALSGIQMGTVRDQMTFALMLNSIKAQLTSKMNANVTGSAGLTLGIDLKAPISLAAWPGEQENFGAVANSAVVLRVKDRARFERTLTMYQTDFGGFASFAPTVSIGTRVASITPAFLPVMFYAVSALSDLASTITSTSNSASGKSSFVGGSSVFVRQEKWGALPITVFEKLGYIGIDATKSERIYLAYLGDTAVLAPTRSALLDVLKSDKPTIITNPSYARIKAEKGELVFFSQFDALVKNLLEEILGAAADAKEKDPFDAVVTEAFSKAFGAETGAVRLSQSDWDSVFHLALGENDFVKVLRPFQAADLGAPRDLLPKQTLLYAATVIDPEKFVAYQTKWLAEMEKSKKATEKKEEKTVATKSGDLFAKLQNLLVPHLQGEVSVALVNVSSLLTGKAKLPAMVLALKLKNDTLAKIARSGLASLALKRVPNATALNAPVFKLDDASDALHVTITDNYFILADSLQTLKLLEDKEKFAATRDFANPAQLAPQRLALFSTLSIDAVFADLRALTGANASAEPNEFLEQMSAWAHAFHSYRLLFAFADDKTLEGQLGLSFDRAGRYHVGAMNREEFDLENALIAPQGLSILKPKRVEALRLKVSARQPGVLARVREDVSKFAWQSVEPTTTDATLIFTSKQRRIPDKLTIKLPVTGAEFAPYLKATARINSNSPEVVKLAQEIAGKERDGRRVADKIGQWTYDNLKWKRVSSTTVETLAAREADCLEHAELYVALARSLGLPARVVSGAAYSGGAFGAHAWVEVYLGQWVEVDPTWGLRDYVDATHLRFEGDGFISYAQLNQVNFEVLEARAMIADYQRDPVRLIKEFAADDTQDTRTLAFDLELSAEQSLGIGAFAKLEEKHREAIIRAFDRAVARVAEDWSTPGSEQANLLSSDIKSNRATFLAAFGQRLYWFSLAARNGIWYVTEIEDADDGERVFAESLQSVLNPTTSVGLIRQAANPDQGLRQLERLLASNGESAPLLLLKANLLLNKRVQERLEKKPNSPESEKKHAVQEPPNEGLLLLEKITARWPDYAPAHFAQANAYDEETREKAIAAYQRYAKLMPLDPRPWENLAFLYDELKRPNEAETAYRETLARDRTNIDRHAELIAFYLRQAQLEKAKTSFADALKLIPDANAIFKAVDWLVQHEYDEEPTPELRQRFEDWLLSFPKELAGSVDGLRSLSEAQRAQQKYDAAIKTLQKAVALNPAGGDQTTISSIYRETKRYAQALSVAEQALKHDPEYAEAHYERACALAQLGRKREALAALKKAIEFDADYAFQLEEEADLQPIAALPEFKALLPKEEPETEAKPEQSKTAKP